MYNKAWYSKYIMMMTVLDPEILESWNLQDW